MLDLPQLQRDRREVENLLRLARYRLGHYETLNEQHLAADARRVVEGHEKLLTTLSTQIEAFTHVASV